MAFMQVRLSSELMETSTSVQIILPQKRATKKLPVLYLLHGYSGDDSNWCRLTSIERYVRNKNVAVVMPAAFNSFYSDLAFGKMKFYSYITQELRSFVVDNFGISDEREDNYIAGLSMGGYGAFKIALNNPHRYCAAASFSGCLDVKGVIENAEKDQRFDVNLVFGKEVEGSCHDLFYQASRVSKLSEKPRLYQSCGTEDFLYQDNIAFREHVKSLGFDYQYSEFPGGHEWDIWDSEVKKVIEWFEIS